jgi:phosphate transport system substrate-binding protein
MYLATAALLLAAPACSKHTDNGGGGDKSSSGKTVDPGTGATDKGGGGLVRIDGSSTVYLITQAVAEEFQKAGKGDATVAKAGTGGGFKKFCRGETDISDASRPIKAEEADACKAAGIDFIELPVAYDGIAVVVNPKVDWVDYLTPAELKKMWEPDAQGKVSSWSQIRDGWPDKKLDLYGPGTDSGTYDYFTDAINGKEHSSRGDYTAGSDPNVLVQGVSNDDTGLAFFGYAYYNDNKDKLKLIPIDDGKDEDGKGPVAPSPDTVASGTYQPLARPLFIYVSTKAMASNPAVKAFVDFYVAQAKDLSADVGYIPLPDKAYELVGKRWTAGTVGSVFANKGSQIGVTVEKLLSTEGP